jgi:hypothetical protein
MNGPAWPDAQPWDIVLFILVAVVVVILNRKSMLSREQAVTEVLVPEHAAPEIISRTTTAKASS